MKKGAFIITTSIVIVIALVLLVYQNNNNDPQESVFQIKKAEAEVVDEVVLHPSDSCIVIENAVPATKTEAEAEKKAKAASEERGRLAAAEEKKRAEAEARKKEVDELHSSENNIDASQYCNMLDTSSPSLNSFKINNKTYQDVAVDIRDIPYVIKPGNTLWNIIKNGTTERPTRRRCEFLAAHNGIKNPNNIWVGQKIMIPKPFKNCQEEVGRNKTNDSKKGLSLALQKTKETWQEIDGDLEVWGVEIDEDKVMSELNRLQEKGELYDFSNMFTFSATYGDGVQGFTQIRTGDQKLNGPVVLVELNDQYGLLICLAVQCGNIYTKMMEVVEVPVPASEDEETDESGEEEGVTFPEIKASRTAIKEDKWDLCGGSGIVGAQKHMKDNWTNYNWLLGSIFIPKGYIIFDHTFFLGLFLNGEYSLGIADGDYEYKTQKVAGGIIVEIYGEHTDYSFRAGIGRIFNKGQVALYRSRQITDISVYSGHLNNYYRRMNKEKLFPDLEINVNYTLPMDTNHHHSWDGVALDPDPYNERIFDALLRLGLIDIEKGDDRYTPSLDIGGGRNWGRDEDYGVLGFSLPMHRDDENVWSAYYRFRKWLDSNDKSHEVGFSVNFRTIGSLFSGSGGEEYKYTPPEREDFSIENGGLMDF